ncbi:gamma carbonic anhydrase family protein [Roseibium aquae]|uniref:Gamma carbonic anhydrase family protein n=1 Tax=Roseibium aquae TaxID=1323746 RepID=A0A916X318_9HYPH|nr:gamma carbonic anhydrase family protein [Roseibium aquae]GGB59579.1 gamma carbonic anhydrase family protein [Roseibium aquae]
MAVYELDGVGPVLPASGHYWIAPTASVIGRVLILEEVSVWFGAVLRGDREPITIGARSNIQDGAVCHADPGFPLTVGQDCTVGHRAILHGCTIGDNTLIGMGATVLNGARIGSNCIVGANALIAEGKVVPDNSLVVGVPGKVVRTIDEAAAAGITQSAAGYVANWKRYSQALKPV